MKKYLLLIALLPVVLYLIFQIPVNLKANTIIVPDDYPTIQGAIDASNHGDTIIVEPGRYIEGINFRGKRITVASRFYTEQDTSYIRRTIIDGNREVFNVVVFESGETRDSKLIGFTITGGNANGDPQIANQVRGGGVRVTFANLYSPPIIKDCIIRDNYASQHGGGIVIITPITLKNTRIFNNISSEFGGGISSVAAWDVVNIINCEIHSNKAREGGGVLLLGGPYRMIDCSIYNNQAIEGYGGGLRLTDVKGTFQNTIVFKNQAEKGAGIFIRRSTSEPEALLLFVNCTITNNLSASSGGGLYIQESGECKIVNSIMHNNSPQEITMDDSLTGSLTISYSNVKGGKEGIELNDNGELEWLEGNIDDDPLFVDAENNDYRLKEGSPCIDAGTSHFIYDGNTIVDLDENDYYGDAPDMGAFQWWGVSTGKNELPLPSGSKIELYPNPFNPVTTIKLSLQKAGDVILGIYNIRGQRVFNLAETFLDKGEHYYNWDGKDDANNPVTSGVYLVKLEHNDEIAVTKTTLMK